MSRVTFVRSRADALSLFCAQFEEVYIYIQRADASIANNSARELFREREREKSLFDDDSL